MSGRFSNFDDDDEVDNAQVSGSSGGKGSSGIRGSNTERVRATTTAETSFDDFDGDWDSEPAGVPQRGATPTFSGSSMSTSSESRHSTRDTGRTQPIDTRNDSTMELELPSSRDLDRRAHLLDDDDDFGNDRPRGGTLRSPFTDNLSSNATNSSTRNPTSSRSFSPSHSGSEPDSFSSLNSSREGPRASRSSPPHADSEKHFESAMPPMPEVQYEPFSVEPPSHYQNYLYLLKYIHGLKILAAIHLVRAHATRISHLCWLPFVSPQTHLNLHSPRSCTGF